MIGKPRVRIAGAGALGLATAFALAEAGCRVEVYDPAADGDNASGVAAGMLAPAFETILDPVSADHFDLLQQGRDLWPALAARAGVDLHRDGALWVGEADQAVAKAEMLQRLGLAPQILVGHRLAQRCPGLAPHLAAGVYTDADWRLDARQAVGALKAAAAKAGVVFHAASAPERAEGLLVVATGASRSLATLAPELAHLSPIKGHILRLDAAPPAPAVVRGEGVYVVPAAVGCIVGATMEAGVSDPTVDPTRAEALARNAARLFPGLAGAAFTASTGVRAATPDGLPLVGPSATPDVVLAVGARRNGWLLAPLVAELVVASVLGDPAGPIGDRLDPARFGALT